MPRVFLLGATGTIGQATARALVAAGHEVVALVRPRSRVPDDRLAGITLRAGDVTDPASLARDGFRGERFDVLVSCLASRTGVPSDAWAIDHQAHVLALSAARAAGVRQVVLLSALCVQKPLLAFQRAKLAFEQALQDEAAADPGFAYTIVRPTAFFKSLAGQVDRVRSGKPFLVFGDGRGTACKPISDDDLGAFLAACMDHPDRRNRILPLGGPGAAITPLDQAAMLSDLLGRPVPVKRVPLGLMDVIVGALSVGGLLLPRLRAKAELARIGRYYATESMLVWDATRGRYDAEATPSAGHDTLRDYYARLLAGTATLERGDHAVF